MFNNILVVRNDKLGDFLLAWPAFAMLKKSLPSAKITALVPAYTAELAKICPYIDEIIIDAGKQGSKKAKQATLLQIKQCRFDAAIAFFSDRYNATLLWQAKIPYRLAPATKIIQFLYNDRLLQRRSKSEKAEFVYNLALSEQFLSKHNLDIVHPTRPYLQFDADTVQRQKQKLCRQLSLSINKSWCFIHSGTGGSAKNLSLSQYAQLAQYLLKQFDCQIVLTAGTGEEKAALTLQQLINDPNVLVYDKNEGLADFAKSIACCDLFIAGSTGPLHLAAALNKAIIGFFPSKRSACALRWQPINDSDKQLLISADPQYAEEEQMLKIDPQTVFMQAKPFLERMLA